MSKMKEKVHYSALQTYKAKHKAYENDCGLIPTQSMLSNELVGIEIEVENIQTSIGNKLALYWKEKEDGSLRNNGKEYVSIPLRGDQVEIALNYLNNALPADRDFSKRTSTHIHLNVRNLDEDEVISLIILYSIFEKHFFAFAKQNRESSMFCVPLYQTTILQGIYEVITSGHSAWSKYTALNILPLVNNNDTGCYGTIEFRHLHGTSDPAKILPFINSIYALYNYVQTVKSKDILEFLDEANSTSGYIQLYHTIFGNLCSQNITSEQLEFCISVAKKNLFRWKVRNTLAPAELQVYNLLENLNNL